jgi:CRISPR-associated protein Cas2
MMLVVVAYDVNTETPIGKRRLRRVAKICEDHGQRVQHSVFECWLDAALMVAFRARLIAETDGAVDSLRFYYMGDNWKGRIEHIGAKPSYQPDEPLIL